MSPIDLDETLIAALKESRDRHEDDWRHEHCKSGADCIDWIVLTALQVYGGERDPSDEIVTACLLWVLDDTVTGLVLKGYVEAAGVDEHGDVTLSLTQMGREAYEDFNDGR